MSIEVKIVGKGNFYVPYVEGMLVGDVLRALPSGEFIAVVVGSDVLGVDRGISDHVSCNVVSSSDKIGLDIIRHDAAHVLAQAVKSLFPEAKLAIGPAIEDGFYYDFDVDKPFSTADLEAIEKKMLEIIKMDESFIRRVVSKSVAEEMVADEPYKLEILSGLPYDAEVTFYSQGSFSDLCRGPHAPSTGYIKAVKLTRVAGAYWRGDVKRTMLQRIYGTAWDSVENMQQYFARLEDAVARDHRKIAREMDLFHIQNEAVGQVFWHPYGWTIYQLLESYIRKKLADCGYVEVRTPIMADRALWERSGHWEKFKDNMFITEEVESRVFAVKPMSCPCHVQIFNHDVRSYKELPIRMAEFGTCHRNESSGSLYGLMRVRGFTQDDAHIFCTEEQICEEVAGFCKLLSEIYSELGFREFSVRFSDRPEVRAGDDMVWDKAESALTDAVNYVGLKYELNSGEGAFYGPKLEFVLKDAIGRSWQCGTLQVDFVLPERLDASYVGADGKKYRPVMLHRAILGTFERFIGIMLEHYAGRLPLWLAPVQLVVVTITNDVGDYAMKVMKIAQESGIRVECDNSADKVGYKIRVHTLRKVPVIWVVGAKEKLIEQVAVRKHGMDMEVLGIVEAVNRIVDEVKGMYIVGAERA